MGDDLARADGCALGHKQRAMECPACAGVPVEGHLDHWRWYRSRTSSKTIKAAIDATIKEALDDQPRGR